MPLKLIAKLVIPAALLLAAVSLGGCGMDDIALNGKLFDAVGLNTGSVKAKEPTLAERAPLVVPPTLDKLPEPGSSAAPADALAEVQDHDAKRQVGQAELQKQQADYCKVNYEQAKQRGDNNADLATGPLGPCRGSVLSIINKADTGSVEEAQ